MPDSSRASERATREPAPAAALSPAHGTFGPASLGPGRQRQQRHRLEARPRPAQGIAPAIPPGLPRYAEQKVRWAAQHFPGTRIITTMARDKRDHAKAGDVLVDDQLRHAHLWEEVGGIFIHHKNVDETLERLKAYFPL
jgi:hypothetical protein